MPEMVSVPMPALLTLLGFLAAAVFGEHRDHGERREQPGHGAESSGGIERVLSHLGQRGDLCRRDARIDAGDRLTRRDHGVDEIVRPRSAIRSGVVTQPSSR